MGLTEKYINCINANRIIETTSKTIPLLFTVMTMFIASGCTNNTIERKKNNNTESTETEFNENRPPDTAISRNEIVPNSIPE